MKATGIVRRIDELGRVVIPKEIRKTLRIAEGTPLEIYTEKDALVLRKYSPITSLEDDAKDFIGTLGEITERKCLLTDNEKIVCVSSPDLKNCQGAAITEEFSALIREKKSALINGDTGSAVAVARGMDKYVSEVAVPVPFGGRSHRRGGHAGRERRKAVRRRGRQTRPARSVFPCAEIQLKSGWYPTPRS